MLSLNETRQLDELRKTLESYGKRLSNMTKAEARAGIIAMGIYTENEDIRPNYGGEPK